MSNVRDTSIESYVQNEESGLADTIGGRIYKFIVANGPVTRRTIATELGLDTATVSGLVTPMIKKGVLVDDERTEDPQTGRKAHAVRVCERWEQGELL